MVVLFFMMNNEKVWLYKIKHKTCRRAEDRNGAGSATSLSAHLHLIRGKKPREKEAEWTPRGCCWVFVLWAKQEEPVFLGIIGRSDQYCCYDETVIEFVVRSLEDTDTVLFPLSLPVWETQSDCCFRRGWGKTFSFNSELFDGSEHLTQGTK